MFPKFVAPESVLGRTSPLVVRGARRGGGGWEWGVRTPSVLGGSPEELQVGRGEAGRGARNGGGEVRQGTPLGHAVYKPNIVSICVSLKVRV